MKKAGKTTRSFRYDINQIPFDYTVKGQIDSRDKIWKAECPRNYGQRFMTLYRRQGGRPSLRKRNDKSIVAVLVCILTNSVRRI